MEDVKFQEDVLIEEDIDLSELEDVLDTRKLVIHNDEVNTFDWVIQSLIDICGHTAIQAEQLSLIVHFKGKAQAREGSYEKLKPMKEGMIDRGINATID